MITNLHITGPFDSATSTDPHGNTQTLDQHVYRAQAQVNGQSAACIVLIDDTLANDATPASIYTLVEKEARSQFHKLEGGP